MMWSEDVASHPISSRPRQFDVGTAESSNETAQAEA